MPENVNIAVGTKDAKLEFSITQPYEEGHVCNALEAKVLNQTRRENIGNNIRSRVQATIAGEKDAMTEEALRAYVTKYDAEYIFTEAAAGGSTASLTPVQREARKLARALILDHLKANGKKVKEIEKEALEAEIVRISEDAAVVKAAEKNVRAHEKDMERLREAVSSADGTAAAA